MAADIIDGLGGILQNALGVGYSGQEPQDKTALTGELVIMERIGGFAGMYARDDAPWIQFTVLAQTKKRASDLLRAIRGVVMEPRTRVGDLYIYRVTEVLAPENATALRDPFYRYRTTFEFHVKGLA